jgi:hypothetical protein
MRPQLQLTDRRAESAAASANNTTKYGGTKTQRARSIPPQQIVARCGSVGRGEKTPHYGCGCLIQLHRSRQPSPAFVVVQPPAAGLERGWPGTK